MCVCVWGGIRVYDKGGISVYDKGGISVYDKGGAELSVCIAHHRGHLFKGDRGESSPQMRLCIAIFGTTYKLNL